MTSGLMSNSTPDWQLYGYCSYDGFHSDAD